MDEMGDTVFPVNIRSVLTGMVFAIRATPQNKRNSVHGSGWRTFVTAQHVMRWASYTSSPWLEK